MTPPKPILSADTLKAISAIATPGDDVKAILTSAGIQYRTREPLASDEIIYVPGAHSHLLESLKALDLTDPSEVSRVLRTLPRFVEFYQASKKFDGTKLARLRMALEEDGFPISRSSNFTEAFSALAAAASGALSDFSGIRAEILRLEKAVPDDPSAAVGRAKNLVEATAKAVLATRGKPASTSESLQALASMATEELGLHPKQAGDEHIQRLHGRLQGMVEDITKLRNAVGDGHGAATAHPLEERHGRLAVWAAVGWATYVLDSMSATQGA
ncbi:abortive infection family protein [Actinomadura geliboluensis]|uniref:abortive infection family protein n=1 Tax=Actinomadura geliboluensis TaxID=882440 RepID=UPI0036A78211